MYLIYADFSSIFTIQIDAFGEPAPGSVYKANFFMKCMFVSTGDASAWYLTEKNSKCNIKKTVWKNCRFRRLCPDRYFKKDEEHIMLYRSDRKGTQLSILGYGCLRFTKKHGQIDLKKTEREILAAIDAGVNYFDTAYVYGGSEAALGTILQRNNLRDSVYIATKLPHYLIKSREGMERCFQEELKRLKTDHVDYYLMHMLTDLSTWKKLCGLGVDDWIREKLDNGQIRNIGFSYHGNTANFLELIDAYDWDFCQIQYNYMDEHSQAGRTGLQYAASRGIPVIIMEPLRGGRLVNLLPETAKKAFAEEGCSPAGTALRWLWDQPEVTVVLSGMNSVKMVKENVRCASHSPVGCMSKKEQKLIEYAKEEISKKIKVGCTGCGYCMPCPHHVDIPGVFRCYNEMYTDTPKTARKEYLRCMAFRKQPHSASNCKSCGKCEKHCPQGIEIRKELKLAAAELETPIYKLICKVISLLKLW